MISILQLRLRVGLYYPYLCDWLKAIPKKQIHITQMEDYAADRMGVLREVAEFLAIGQSKLLCPVAASRIHAYLEIDLNKKCSNWA